MRWFAPTILAVALAAAAPAFASEIVVVGDGGARITVLDAGDVAAYVSEEEGRPVIRLPNGDAWELIESTDDPEIVNPGDGSFHPVDPGEVASAVRALDGVFTRAVDATIYILPMPRRGLLDSSAGDGVIYLSPGVRPAAPAQVHALVAHEFGHVVHRRFLPDSDAAGWAAYRGLRGIVDESVYSASAPHRNRPHEIFAEDFRYLFGGTQANASGSIENGDLPLPDAVAGLEDWMLGLASSSAPVPMAVANFPDPFTAKTTIRWSMPLGEEGAWSSLEVFDASGRLVRSFAGAAGGAIRSVTWDGRDAQGRRAAAGVYFALLTSGSRRVSEPLRLVR